MQVQSDLENYCPFIKCLTINWALQYYAGYLENAALKFSTKMPEG